MTVNQRLKQYIDSKGINQIELSRLCHISAAAVSSWFNSIQKKIPSERLIQIIIEYRDLDPRWLLIGEGEMGLNVVEWEPCHIDGLGIRIALDTQLTAGGFQKVVVDDLVDTCA